MLVLSRRPSEGIKISVGREQLVKMLRTIRGETIQFARVTVEGTRGNKTRLGIDAPPEVKVLRDEVGCAMQGFESRYGDGEVHRNTN